VQFLARTGIVAGKIPDFPGPKGGTDLVPVLDRGAQIPQHPRLKIAQLTDFQR
jgi:hypothetical protein